MYSSVPPPNQDSSVADREGQKYEQNPPRGISKEMWEKFQHLKERRIKCCKPSTANRIKDIQKKVTKSVLNNLKSDEELAILCDHGVVHQVGKKNKQNSSQQKEKNKTTKDNERRWSELQQYIKPDSDNHISVPGLSEDHIEKPSVKDQIEESLEAAVKEKRFEAAEELNKKLMEHSFAVKVAQAVECRDYAKRKAVDEERAKKRKRSKPHWAFEQKARWESKGNM